jgi:hypothetical protein
MQRLLFARVESERPRAGLVVPQDWRLICLAMVALVCSAAFAVWQELRSQGTSASAQPRSVQQPRRQPPPEQTDASQHQRGSPQQSTGGETEMSDSANNSKPVAGGNSTDAARNKRSPEWIMAQGAVASAFIGFLVLIGQLWLGVETDNQRRLMSGQLRTMRLQTAAMQDQLAEMRSAGQQAERLIAATSTIGEQTTRVAGAAVSSADTAERSLKITQKPVISAAMPDSLNPNSAPFNFVVTLYNVGATSATNAKIQAVYYVTQDLEKNFDYKSSIVDQYGNSVGFLIPSKLFINTSRSKPLGLTENEKTILKNSGFLLVLGIVRYDDEFGDSYEMHFCNRYQFNPSFSEMSKGLCPLWNDLVEISGH